MAKGVASEISGVSNKIVIYKDNSGAIQGLSYWNSRTIIKSKFWCEWFMNLEQYQT